MYKPAIDYKVRNLQQFSMKKPAIYLLIVFILLFSWSVVAASPPDSCGRFIRQYRLKGYFLANAHWDGKNCQVDKGKLFRIALASNSAAGLDSGRYYSPEELSASVQLWLKRLEDSGYPFASAELLPEYISDSSVILKIKTETGPLCMFDSIADLSFGKSGKLLLNAAGIKVNTPFSMQKIHILRQRTAALSAYKAGSEPSLYFSEGRFTVMTGVRKVKRDRLSGIVGLATAEGSRPVFTGEVDMAFYELFRHGISFQFNWRSFAPLSQQLQAQSELPFLFKSPLILVPSIQFEKLDSQFTRFRRGMAFRIPIDATKNITFGADYTGINALSVNEAVVRNLRQLPVIVSMSQSMYYAAAEFKNTNTADLPEKGWEAQFKGGAGQKRLLRDNRISEIRWTGTDGNLINIYDSLEPLGRLKQNQYRFSYSVNGYIRLKKSLVLRLAAEGEEIRAAQIYYSELSRWGGISNLRGYPEQSIFANRFHMATAELRLQAAGAGYIAPFYSLAWNENDAGQNRLKNRWLWGAGIAAALRTGAGVLKLAWASGPDAESRFKLSNTRLHVGLSNAF